MEQTASRPTKADPVQPARFGALARLRSPAAWTVLAAGFALVPPVLMAVFIGQHSVNTVSNDYLRFLSLADRVLSAGYDWSGYFRDSFDNNVHSYAFLFLFRLALAALSRMSLYAETAVGLALGVVKAWLLWRILARAAGAGGLKKALLLPVISALVFSPSQVSAYQFGETALQMGFIHVFILAGLDGLLSRPGSRSALAGMGACGVLASYSGGSGVLGWPLFLLAIALTTPKRWGAYAAWLGFALIGLWPYLAYSRSFSPLAGGTGAAVRWPPLARLVTGLGLPMANEINYGLAEHAGALISGWVGLALLLVLALAFMRSERAGRAMLAPGLLVAWGLLGTTQINLSRGTMAPWYTPTLAWLWIGLAGGFFLLGLSNPARGLRWIGWGGLAAVAALYAVTNHSYVDKSFYDKSLGPAPAACLRAYATAPTTCEGLVFLWGVGSPGSLAKMGSILEKRGWSVLGPEQLWTAQGDRALGRVLFENPREGAWVGAAGTPAHWLDSPRLDVLLQPGQTLWWEIPIPALARRMTLEMGVSTAGAVNCRESALSVAVDQGAGWEMLFQTENLCGYERARMLHHELKANAPRLSTLRITNLGSAPVRLGSPALRVDVLPEPPGGFTMPEIRPENTDLSPRLRRFSETEGESLMLDESKITASGLEPDGARLKLASIGPSKLTAPVSPPACKADWPDFTIGAALSDSFPKKALRLWFYFTQGDGPMQARFADLPLLAGEDAHLYTVDLDLARIPADACIHQVEVEPYALGADRSKLWMQLGSFGWLRFR